MLRPARLSIMVMAALFLAACGAASPSATLPAATAPATAPASAVPSVAPPSATASPPAARVLNDPVVICAGFIAAGLSQASFEGGCGSGVDGGAYVEADGSYMAAQAFYPMSPKASLDQIKSILKIALPASLSETATTWVIRAFARPEAAAWGQYFGPVLINVYNSSRIDPVGTPNNGYALGIADCGLAPFLCAPLLPFGDPGCEGGASTTYCTLPKI